MDGWMDGWMDSDYDTFHSDSPTLSGKSRVQGLVYTVSAKKLPTV